MSVKADLTISLVLPDEEHYPSDGFCKTGHFVKENCLVSGKIIPTRFFLIAGPVLPKKFHGVYCEECLSKAQSISKQQKSLKTN